MTDFFPIDQALPSIREALARSSTLILQAAPGAGKTTRVPLALYNEAWMEGQMIVMLEPRRLAARMAARWMAHLLGEKVGQTVGYTIRFDSCRSAETRILVVTEGVLTRLIQNDPSLEGIGAVIFDEFHERSLNSDLGLALCLDVQRSLREDLRLLVMSATLNVEPLSALLQTQNVIDCPGRVYPVETAYLGDGETGIPSPLAVTRAILKALKETEGDILVFLPGVGEISRTQALLEERTEKDLLIAPLYGDLKQEEQDRAVLAAPPGRRKVVLATSIAETSLTVDGVRVVIDSGWRRVSRFDPRSGMERLVSVRIAQASASQRRGRAGRQGPGQCFRLWSEATQRTLAPYETPEIQEADLAPLALDLAVWGVEDPDALDWLDPPPAASFAQARTLLRSLGALDETDKPTRQGRDMATLAAHPRLAAMMLEGRQYRQGALACRIAALLSERDILKGKERDTDIRTRLEALSGSHAAIVDRNAVRRVLRLADQWNRRMRIPSGDLSGDPGLLLAFAYPDRIARCRDREHRSYLMTNGQRAFFRDPEPLAAEEWLSIADLDGDRTNARIYLAVPLNETTIEDVFASRIRTKRIVAWDERTETVRAIEQRRLGALTLKETPLDPKHSKEEQTEAFLEGVRRMGLSCLPWTDASRKWRQRIAFLRRIDGDDWPDLSDKALLDTLDQWLAPYVEGMVRRAHLDRLDLLSILQSALDWDRQTRLDRMAPSHLAVPSGSTIPIDYSTEEPVLAVRLQEMFGLQDTPRIADGRVPLLLHLLSPAHRPVQVTRDLKSFWNRGYRAVKADLMGRYPKHHWPDNPLEAEPTARAKRRNR